VRVLEDDTKLDGGIRLRRGGRRRLGGDLDARPRCEGGRRASWTPVDEDAAVLDPTLHRGTRLDAAGAGEEGDDELVQAIARVLGGGDEGERRQ
jgi:hypothetical protein